ncbi:MAG: autotransporter outer membrane beta-barrel domain-containing protein [Nonlabens sp.]|nr:autotransporter outer membrane beta-barrel domain-containing protein [Nonlabens sp.]
MKNICYLLMFLTVIAVAQQDSTYIDAVHLREIPKHNLAVDLGVAQPLGDFNDFAGSGLSIGLTYEKYNNKNWGTSIALRHQSNQSIARNANVVFEGSNTTYEHTSIALGPVYSYTNNRFQVDIAPRLGILFLNAPLDERYANAVGDILYPLELDRANSSRRSLYGEVTVRFNYYFRRSVQVYAAPTFTTAFGEPYNYLSFPENVAVNPSNFIFNIGVKIAIGPKYSNGELRDDTF